MFEQGRKYDGGKLRYDLIPVLALEEMVKGLTFGTIKYDDNNWVKVPNGRKRYLSAALRHIQEYRKGVLWDEEQNIHHLSAAMNNLSFIVEKDLRGWEDVEEESTTDVDDISTEELKAYVDSVVEAQKPIQCEHCTHGWLPWPLSNKREGSPCHMCQNGEVRKTLEDDFSVLGNGKIALSLSEDTLKNYVNTLNVKIVDDKFEVSPKLWYPPVKEGENPWIEYDGSGQPVSNGVQVVCMEKQERLYESMIHECITSAEDNNWVWEFGKSGDAVRADLCDIVAYRIVS